MPEFDATLVYRDVPGFPGYRAGSDGSVWSCWGKASSGRPGHGKGTIRTVMVDRWKRMKQSMDRRRRMRVGLCRDGKVFRLHVHRVVLLSFVGTCPSGMEACHFPDRDPANCHLWNLRWDTRSANQEDREVHGTVFRGEAHGMHKLAAADVRQIRSSTEPGNLLAERFGVTATLIRLIRQRKIWQSVA